jgi:tetratricopeptide (TPR) repeat protein
LLILTLVTAAVFGQCLGHQFLNWDDQHYVSRNPVVQGVSLDHIRAVFTSYYVGNYAPVQMLSYMLDHALWGLWPGGYLLTNLFCHLAAGILFYFLVLRISGRDALALLAALLFLVHPVQVETVAWISQRKNLLAMVFFLASWYAYLSCRDARPREGRWLLGGSLACFLLAALAKSVVVILPVVLVLYDLGIRRERLRESLQLHKLAYLGITVLTAWLAMESQAERPAEPHGGSLTAPILTMIHLVVRYLYMLVWPVDLSAIYYTPPRTQVDVTFMLALLFLLAVLALAMFLYRRRDPLAFWIALFFVGLLPVSQLVPLVTLINDRYLYFPMLGSAMVAATLLVTLHDRVPVRLRIGIVAAATVLVVALAALAYQRTGVWRDSISLWSDALQKTPQKAVPAYYLGLAYLNAGDPASALPYLQQSIDLTQHREKSPVVVLATLHLRLRQYAEAAPLIEWLGQNFPDDLKTWLLHGDFYSSQGDFVRGEEAYRRSLAVAPDNPDGLIGLGRIYSWAQEWDKARGYLLRALQTGGNNPEVLFELACVETARGAYPDALGYLRGAVRHGLAAPQRIYYDSRLRPLAAFPEFRELLAGQ